MQTAPMHLMPAHQPRFVRSGDGLIAGVCEGLGRRFGIDPWLVRIGWIASVALLGTGLFAYIVLAFTLPREDRLEEVECKKMLGVCLRLAHATGMEVGVVRALAVFLAFASFGATIVGYLVLHFVMPDEPNAITI